MPSRAEHDERRATRGPAVGVRVEADDHVRQPHGAEEGRDHERVGRVETLVALAERHRPAGAPAARVAAGRRRTRSPAGPRPGSSSAVSLSQYWNACTKVMLRIPPLPTLTTTTTPTTTAPTHSGASMAAVEGEPGALELGQQVEPADRDHEHRAERAHPTRAQPGLGEVGQRVGAAAAQRGGHEDQQHEVARGPADRVPEHVGAGGEHQRRRRRGTTRRRGTRRRSPTR